MKKSNYSKKRRGLKHRVLLTLVMAILFVIFASSVTAKNHINTKEIYITQGDTLWSVARDAIKENKNMNIQKVVCEIEKINNITDSNIYAGQTIEIPVY